MANRITAYENEYATMWYYPDKKIVHHQVKKFIFGQTFYDFILTGTELIKKHKARKWLSDDRLVPVLKTEDIEWGATHWFPQTVAAGWKYWAIVEPQHAMGHMNLEDLKERYSKGGITAQFFTSVEAAMKWLEEQP